MVQLNGLWKSLPSNEGVPITSEIAEKVLGELICWKTWINLSQPSSNAVLREVSETAV